MSFILESKCLIDNYINSESLPQSIEYLYFGGNNNYPPILPHDMKYSNIYSTNISLTESTVLFSDSVSVSFAADNNENNVLYDIKMSQYFKRHHDQIIQQHTNTKTKTKMNLKTNPNIH